MGEDTRVWFLVQEVLQSAEALIYVLVALLILWIVWRKSRRIK